jgi:leucyl aminopeptidase (aminopeptidase T)
MGLSMELMEATKKLMNDVLLVKEGETIVILADSGSDMDAVNATALAADLAGAIPTVISYKKNPRVMMDPPKPAAAAVMSADIVIELLSIYSFYSDTFEAFEKAQKGRGICLASRRSADLINTFGKVDYPKAMKLGEKLVELTNKAKVVRLTSAIGTDLTGNKEGRTAIQSGGIANKPGFQTLLGLVSFCPIEETINGTMALEWTTQSGHIRNPIICEAENGYVTEIKGGKEARILEGFLSSFDDPNMYRIAHLSFGFNPGLIPRGGIIEPHIMGIVANAERVFGSFTFGWGKQGSRIGGAGWNAAAHTDQGEFNPSVWLDDTLIEEDGKYIHPELVKICKEMGIPGY